MYTTITIEVDMFEVIFGIVLCVVGFFFVYMSCHINQEEKEGRHIPLPWEKKYKVFDKSDIKYRDGDNT